MNALDFVQRISDSLGWGDVSTIEGTPGADVDRIMRASNTILRATQADANWPELRKQGFISLAAPETEENGAWVSYGDDEISIVDFTDWDDYEGWQLSVGDYTDKYTITGEGSATSMAAITRPWANASVTNESYSLTKEMYSLPSDFDRLVSQKFLNMTSKLEVDVIDPIAMRKHKNEHSNDVTAGEPEKLTIYGRDSDGNSIVYLDRAPDDAYILEFEYQAHHPELGADDTALILYPERLMLALQDAVIARLDRDAENSAMTQLASADALREKARAEANPSSQSEMMQLYPNRQTRGYRRRR